MIDLVDSGDWGWRGVRRWVVHAARPARLPLAAHKHRDTDTHRQDAAHAKQETQRVFTDVGVDCQSCAHHNGGTRSAAHA